MYEIRQLKNGCKKKFNDNSKICIDCEEEFNVDNDFKPSYLSKLEFVFIF